MRDDDFMDEAELLVDEAERPFSWLAAAIELGDMAEARLWLDHLARDNPAVAEQVDAGRFGTESPRAPMRVCERVSQCRLS